MDTTLSTDAIAAGREIVITRTVDAPRGLVFAAWTDPNHLVHWWGPNGFTTPVCEFDARPGGAIRIEMRAPDGSVQQVRGRVEEIVAPARLVFSTMLVDADEAPFFEGLNIVTFAELDGRTAITLTSRVVSTGAVDLGDIGGMNEGWRQSIERFAAHVEEASRGRSGAAAFDGADVADREIRTTRLFDAPRELVFKVWTDPKHVVHWWGPKGFTNTIETMDVRPGGVWKFVMHGPDGVDYPNRIVYQEIVEPARLVYTHDSGEDDEAGQFHGIVDFAEEDGKTRITMRIVFRSAAERDQVIEEVGAVDGMRSTLDCLEEYLAKL